MHVGAVMRGQKIRWEGGGCGQAVAAKDSAGDRTRLTMRREGAVETGLIISLVPRLAQTRRRGGSLGVSP